MALYSDSRIVDEIRDLGPYSILNTIGAARDPRPGQSTCALILRVNQYTAADIHLDPANPQTDVKAYHGGWVDEEFAALLSLVLGMRCRSGGLTRTWWGPEPDPLGSPLEAVRNPPYLLAPDRGGPSMLPRISRQIRLSQARELLVTYPNLSAKRASALVRAARLYQSAVWIADGDPNLGWLQLVSALEAVVIVAQKDRRPAIERVKSAWPELATLLAQVEESAQDALARLLIGQVRVTSRVLKFIAVHHPPEPIARPDSWAQINWDALPDLVRDVYDWRSRALHDGVPMPAPMCTPPIVVGSAPQEGWGAAGGIGAAGGTSADKDIPMTLHIFADVVRRSVLQWWCKATGGAATVPAE
jgi:hypothetical protein